MTTTWQRLLVNLQNMPATDGSEPHEDGRVGVIDASDVLGENPTNYDVNTPTDFLWHIVPNGIL